MIENNKHLCITLIGLKQIIFTSISCSYFFLPFTISRRTEFLSSITPFYLFISGTSSIESSY